MSVLKLGVLTEHHFTENVTYPRSSDKSEAIFKEEAKLQKECRFLRKLRLYIHVKNSDQPKNCKEKFHSEGRY